MKKDHIFMGHSSGTRVGRVFAAKYHEEVTGMVLIDAGFLYDDPRYPAETLSEFESENNMIRTARWLAPFGLVRLLRPIIISEPTFDLPEQARLASTSFTATSSFWQSLNAQGEALSIVFQEGRQVTSLGDIPLLGLVSTNPNDVAHQIWRQANIEMADFSTNGNHHIVENATHMSLAYRKNDAQVCADGILEVLNAVHDRQSLSQRTE